MFPYGYTQSPRCIGPECDLTIINPADSSKNISLKAIVDSGAVVTVIPEEQIWNSGNIVRDQEILVKNADGSIAEVNTYYVKLQIADKELMIKAVAIRNKRYALIGRDILNEYKVVFDAVREPRPEWRFNCQGCCDSTLMIESED